MKKKAAPDPAETPEKNFALADWAIRVQKSLGLSQEKFTEAIGLKARTAVGKWSMTGPNRQAPGEVKTVAKIWDMALPGTPPPPGFEAMFGGKPKEEALDADAARLAARLAGLHGRPAPMSDRSATTSTGTNPGAEDDSDPRILVRNDLDRRRRQGFPVVVGFDR